MPTRHASLPDWLSSLTGETGETPSALPVAADSVGATLADLLAGWTSGIAPDSDGPVRNGDGFLGGAAGVFDRAGHVRNTDGDDTITGDADTDTVWFTGRANATVDLGLTTAQNTGYGTDTITNIDNATGGRGHDRLTGNANANHLIGGKGNDTLVGLAGDDTLSGKRGADSLTGGDGADLLYGGHDADRLAGDAGNDRLWGGTGNDMLDGGAGDDKLWGGMGRDTLTGGAGDDVLRGDGHHDHPWFGFGSSYSVSGRPSDGGHEDSGAHTGNGLWGSIASRLPGFGHTDTPTTPEEGNTFVGSAAGWLSDRLGTSVPRPAPGPFDDSLDGGAGNDRMWGGLGNDTLLGGAGDDTLTGGAGADRFVFAPDGGDDTVTDFNRAQGDRIVLDRSLFATGTTLEEVVAEYAANSAAGVTIATEEGTTILLEGTATLTVADLAWA